MQIAIKVLDILGFLSSSIEKEAPHSSSSIIITHTDDVQLRDMGTHSLGTLDAIFDASSQTQRNYSRATLIKYCPYLFLAKGSANFDNCSRLI